MLGWILCASLSAMETQVLFDGNSPGDWNTARDEARLAREFSVSELKGDGSPASLVWRFVSKGVVFNDIFLMRPVARDFDRIRVQVKNEGEAFRLGSKVRDDHGAEWAAGEAALARNAEWQWVEFPRSQWKVASWSRDPDGKLNFPLASFTVIAFGVRPGTEYKLRIGRVEVVRPDPPVADLLRFNLPETVDAGRTFAVDLSFTVDRPCKENEVYLSLRRDGVESLRLPISLPTSLEQVAPGRRVDVDKATLRVPTFAFGGKFSVALCLGEAKIHRQGKDVSEETAVVTVRARTPEKTTAEVKRHNGVPTLWINGKLHNGMAWATYQPTAAVFRDFGEAGVNLYTFSGTPTEAGYNLSKTVWTSPDTYDYSQFDHRVQMLLEANPNAYFFPRLYLHAPKWWTKQHPDDVVRMAADDGTYVPFIHAGDRPAPSWASEAWRKDTVAGLKRLIAHIEASPYADRVVGYHIASGTTEEWMMWGGNEHQWVDYSPVNIARFRAWLEAKYRTVERLRAAWGDGNVTFANATIPTKAQRQQAELGSLRDPRKEQASIDYYQYNSALVADTIGYFAKAVKDMTHREKTVGVFYGYLLQLCGEQRQQNAGHLALEQVLGSPDIDFVCSPTSYAFRQLGGEGTCHFMSLLGSVQLHGKVWFDENDVRTSLAPGKLGTWGRPADVAGDLLQQDKELAYCLVHGSAQWWFDVGANRYDDPVLMGRIGKLARHATETLALNRTPSDEVALVVDETSLTYLRVADSLGASLLLRQLPSLHRMGAPVSHYLTSDLPKIADRKVFLITTSFAPSEADRKAIDALKRDGHVLVFCWAAGLYRDGQLDESAMADLTGIRLRMSNETTPLRVTLSGRHSLTEGIMGEAYGPNQSTRPVIYADDPQAIVLGTLPNGKPGLVVKEHPGWTAIHSAAPLLPASLLRRIAQRGGVHLYLDTEDVVWASHDLVAVSVKEPGQRTIRLPRKAKVRDLYSGETLGTGLDRFQAEFPSHATRVFVLE
jgi:hypothetical protein